MNTSEPRCNRSRRGLTMAIAIFLLALVAIALVSVAQLVRDDARRTLREAEDAQSRLVTLAGITAAQQELRLHNAVPAELIVPLPDELHDAKLRLNGRQVDDHWVVGITVEIDDVQTITEMTFFQQHGAWQVTGSQPTTRSTTLPTSQP